MTKLFIIRHCQAEGNVYRFLQGHFDGKVTPFGYLQVDALAERMKDEKIDEVYSSDLSRACATAEALLRYRPEIRLHVEPRLREINMGIWEAVPMGNVIYDSYDSVKLFMKDSPDWRVPCAETFEEVGKRMYWAIAEIALRHPGKTVAIVSHGVAIRCFLAAAMGVPLHEATDIPLSRNTAVSLFTWDCGKFIPEYINDASHLDSLCTAARYEPFTKNAVFLRSQTVTPKSIEQYYKDCYEKSWHFAHGSLNGFNPETYYKNARTHYAADSESIIAVYDGNKRAGLLDLDPKRGKEDGAGWISLLYLEKEYRGRGLAPQILGMAVLFFQKRGRSKLRLTCAESNVKAMQFYKNYGFTEKDRHVTENGEIVLMEKEI